jgi:hypothetical protein
VPHFAAASALLMQKGNVFGKNNAPVDFQQ